MVNVGDVIFSRSPLAIYSAFSHAVLLKMSFDVHASKSIGTSLFSMSGPETDGAGFF